MIENPSMERMRKNVNSILTREAISPHHEHHSDTEMGNGSGVSNIYIKQYLRKE
jgi:hypothetical protein